MKKITSLLLAVLFVVSFTVMSTAKDMEKGSAMDMKAQEQAEAIVEEVAEQVTEQWASAAAGWATMVGTQADSKVSGRVDFVETGNGVQVVAAFSNVTPPGKHGIHIHQNGSCDDGGKAAGGHFNPGKTKHGFLPKDGHEHAHSGDMGNIEIDENGSGSLVIFLPGLSLTSGPNNIAGKAVILHAKEDDFGQPTGNAGGRIGCGIIGLSN